MQLLLILKLSLQSLCEELLLEVMILVCFPLLNRYVITPYCFVYKASYFCCFYLMFAYLCMVIAITRYSSFWICFPVVFLYQAHISKVSLFIHFVVMPISVYWWIGARQLNLFRSLCDFLIFRLYNQKYLVCLYFTYFQPFSALQVLFKHISSFTLVHSNSLTQNTIVFINTSAVR